MNPDPCPSKHPQPIFPTSADSLGFLDTPAPCTRTADLPITETDRQTDRHLLQGAWGWAAGMRSELQVPAALAPRAGTPYLMAKQGAQKSPEEVRQDLPESPGSLVELNPHSANTSSCSLV